jgi:hypothetical protein
MIWGLDIAYWVMILYGVISLFVGGTLYELEKPKPTDDFAAILAPAFLWPFAVVIFGGWGLVWCLSWIPRGPVRLVLWLMKRRTNLPEAKVHNA